METLYRHNIKCTYKLRENYHFHRLKFKWHALAIHIESNGGKNWIDNRNNSCVQNGLPLQKKSAA